MRALKAVVIVLGVLILAGTTILVVTIIRRAQRLGEPRPVEITAPVGPPRGFDTARVKLPPGSEVVETRAAGERLVLRVRLPGGEERLILLDMGSGAVTGTIVLEPAP